MKILRTRMESVKFGVESYVELNRKIKGLYAHNILSVKSCNPKFTDTRHWFEVIYEKYEN